MKILGDDRELNTTHRAVLTGNVVVSAFADALRTHPPISEKETVKEKERQLKIEEDVDISENGGPSLVKLAPLPLPPGLAPALLSLRRKKTHRCIHLTTATNILLILQTCGALSLWFVRARIFGPGRKVLGLSLGPKLGTLNPQIRVTTSSIM